MRKTLVPLLIAFAGCDASDALITDDAVELPGPDTERASDPDLALEAELRTAPAHDALFDAAAQEFNVPAPLLKALSFSLTRYDMVVPEEEFETDPELAVDGVPMGAESASGFGMMALSAKELETAATLAGVTVAQAKSDALPNVRAAAALLSSWAQEMNINRTQIKAWLPVIARYSGIEDAEDRTAFARDEVFEVLRLGVGELRTPHEDISVGTQNLDTSEYATIAQELTAGPDYSRAVWYPSKHYSTRSRKPAMVIIHTCEAPYTGCRNYLRSNTRSVSAHYVVGTTEVAQLVRESQRAHHIGATYNSKLNSNVLASLNGVGANHFTIGLEHGGYASQKTFPTSQLDNSARLVCDISKGHGIARDRFHIVGHGQLQPYNRTDPGKNWPWSSYIAKVNSFCNSNPPPPKPPTPPPAGAVVIDSNNARNATSNHYVKVSSNWVGTASSPGYYGTGYYYASTKPVSDAAEFYFYLSAPATKTIEGFWVAGANRSSAAPFVAFNAAGAKLGTKNVNQKVSGKTWVNVGTYNFSAGWNKVVVSRWAAEGSVVIADAIRVR